MEVIAIGRKIDPGVKPLIDDYQSRLRSPFSVSWRLIPYSKLSGDQARRDESARILDKISEKHYVILLDETGDNIDSIVMASRLEKILSVGSKKIIFIIGGAYGVDNTVVDRADFTWSLSRLVFPHHIVHLILTEQIYRAQEILKGGSYHHK